MKANKEELGFKDLLMIFVPKIWLIVIVALVFSLGLGIYSGFIQSDTYTAGATMMISKSNTSVNSSDRDLASDMVDTYKVVIFSNDFLLAVGADIKNNEAYADKNWDLSPSALASAISISRYENTEAFEISVTSNDPDLAYAVAHSLSEAVCDDLPNKLPYEKGSLYTTIINSAVPPVSPNSKNILRNSLIGFIVGAILAMLVVFLNTMFDVTIRDIKKIEDNFDIPVLGIIPRYVSDEEASK